MATFAGAARGDTLVAVFTAPPAFGEVTPQWEAIQSEESRSGDLVANLPTSFMTRTISGSSRRRTTFEDYYNRIWLIPSLVDFGSLSNTQLGEFAIWNANLFPVEVESVSLPADPSLSLISPTAGVLYRPLQLRSGSLIASQDGDPSIDAQLTFVFDNGDYAVLSVTGTRARFLPFAPNWDDGVTVTLDYRTEVQTSHNRKEMRIAARQTSRKSIEYQCIAPQRLFRSLLGFMNINQNRLTMVPEFSRGAHLAIDAASGSSSIQIEESVDWAVVGQSVALFEGGILGTRSEVRKISSVSGSDLVLSGALGENWAAGSKVYPVLSGYLANSISAEMLNNNTARLKIFLEVAPGSEPSISYGTPEATFDGRELFLKKPDWSETPTVSFEAIREQLDYGIGRISNEYPVDFTSRMSKMTYLGRDREDAETFVRFFHRHMGQQGEFFMPTYTEDMIVKGEVDAESFTLRIEGDEIARDFEILAVYRHVILFFYDGSYLIRRVESSTLIDDAIGRDTGLVMSEVWGESFSADDVSLTCWLPMWRFASDSLVISWLTDGVAQFAVNLKALEYEPAE